MDITDRVVVVTGAGGGIGRALCASFAAAGARAVACVDLSPDRAEVTAQLMGARHPAVRSLVLGADAAREADVASVVRRVTQELGQVDIFCSNAGLTTAGGVETLDSDWQRLWDVNVMAHVYAARAVLPQMLARGDGHLVNTASAAGLLTNLGALTYSVTKHAAVALAEWLAITHGPSGIRVSCFCPQGVDTPMLRGVGDVDGGVAARAVELAGDVISPEQAAEAVIEGVRADRFLILTHPEVRRYMERRAGNTDRWIGGMQRVQRSLEEPPGGQTGPPASPESAPGVSDR
jgi:NAD(P)-dependent dehydrogenase (short-subunit alcohol dehydrogenase family)